VRLSGLWAGYPLLPALFLVLISVKGRDNPRVMAQQEGLGQLRNPMTSLGIEPTCSIVPEQTKKQTPWPLVRERTIPTGRPPLVDEI
jgi:hypothetical protein